MRTALSKYAARAASQSLSSAQLIAASLGDTLAKYFHRRRRWHDPWLVFNMAIFNSEDNWTRFFDPLRPSARG